MKRYKNHSVITTETGTYRVFADGMYWHILESSPFGGTLKTSQGGYLTREEAEAKAEAM
ncbi:MULTISPECIES: hypothetical protein [unclassified Ruegeria]|uniref:hypothetical protein n=1 Tax=unclassified Ruegeria TaxID=2625375 RepID=UPI001487E881|nr:MULTISPECIES: hypothetical protein [unclassified Ruegeria]NOE32494.1 hypothetical protein [Ruegeria sp. HKCCD7318]